MLCRREASIKDFDGAVSGTGDQFILKQIERCLWV